MDYTNEEATLLCSRLLRQGYVKKTEFPNLELDEHLLREVQDKLAQVGLELVLNTYSPFYAVRFQPKTQETIDQSNNLGLKNSEIAMLVILWCKLILPKRISMESSIKTKEADTTPLEQLNPIAQEVPVALSQGDLIAPELNPAQPDPVSEPLSKEEEDILEKEKKESHKIFVKMKELWAEFGEHFSSKTFFKAILTRLSRLQFIRIHNEIITEGIFLDLLIDGHQMGNEIKRSALAYKLAGLGDEDEEKEDFLDDEEEEMVEVSELEQEAQEEGEEFGQEADIEE